MGERAMVPPGSLLIAGLPATGKSTFGDWLEEHKGYFHLDFDEEPLVQQRGFGREQQLLWKQEQAEPLVEALRARHQPVVLTWGFAPKFLPLVERLLTHGFVPVWFAADPALSRRVFVVRGGIDVKYFDQFLATLLPIEPEIIRVFRGQVLRPLHDDGTRLPPSAVFSEEIGALSADEQRHLCELDWERSAVLLPPGCYLNHSCEPSAMGSGVNVYAWQPIAAGDEITIDYRLNACGDEQWPCACGSPSCSGVITGSFFALAPGLQQAYLRYAPPFIQAEYRRRTNASEE